MRKQKQQRTAIFVLRSTMLFPRFSFMNKRTRIALNTYEEEKENGARKKCSGNMCKYEHQIHRHYGGNQQQQHRITHRAISLFSNSMLSGCLSDSLLLC